MDLRDQINFSKDLISGFGLENELFRTIFSSSHPNV